MPKFDIRRVSEWAGLVLTTRMGFNFPRTKSVAQVIAIRRAIVAEGRHGTPSCETL